LPSGSFANSIVKQAAVLAAATLIVRFIGFLYRIPLTNLIGDRGNAYYAAGFNIYMLLLIVSAGAMPAAISKLVAERQAKGQYRNAHEIFKTAVYAGLVTGTIGAVFMWFGADWIARFFGYPESKYAIRTLSPTIFIVAIMAVYRGYFHGMRNTVPTAVSQVIEGILNAVFSIWLAKVFFDAAYIEYAAAGGTAGTGIGALAGLLIMVGIYAMAKPQIIARVKKDRGAGEYESRRKLLAALIRTAVPIIIGMSIFAIINIIDQKMVASRLAAAGFSPEDATDLFGQFTGKYIVLTTLPVSISIALAAAVVPNIAKSQAEKEEKETVDKINMALRLSMAISIPAAVGLGILGEPILMMLFPNYSEGARLLQVGVVSIIFISFVQIITGVLQGLGKVNAPVIGAFFGMLIKIPLNYFLIAIPGINVIGAVISTCACYLLAGCIDMFFLYKYTKIKPDYTGVMLKPLCASVMMGLACYVTYYVLMELAGRNTVAVMGSILAGLLMYGVYMVMIKGFNKEDLLKLPMGRLSKYIV
jgi:stage V sporulation protein B